MEKLVQELSSYDQIGKFQWITDLVKYFFSLILCTKPACQLLCQWAFLCVCACVPVCVHIHLQVCPWRPEVSSRWLIVVSFAVGSSLILLNRLASKFWAPPVFQSLVYNWACNMHCQAQLLCMGAGCQNVGP